MTTSDLKRKLAAILSADVKGYSRLMGEDEEWTVRTLNAHKGVIRNLVGQHRGRVVDAPGDNVLAEFSSVVDAVQCAVEIQQVLKAKNALLPEARRMEFRIGINLGDVIEEEDRIYGDGVNIAARLEGLAEPGGICISETAYLQIENKLPLQYDFMGEHEVKNIARPVKAYRALLEPTAPERVEGRTAKREARGDRRNGGSARRRAYGIGLAAVVVILAGGAALWEFVFRPSPPAVEKADPKKMAYPLPEKPSVAVLPFLNMSDDPKQEFFSDGITEEIITALSKSPHVFVIARNSTFTYKGKPVKAKQVAEELGVRYVLEGSVRRSAEKVRITAQFIDALTGQHLWAERYDRELKEIFVLQDEITMKVMTALHVRLGAGDHVPVLGRGARNLEAFLKAMEAREHLYRYTKEDNALARKIYEEVTALDANYAVAWAGLGGTYVTDVWLGTSKSPKESLGRAIELGQKAIALDESSAMAHAGLAYFYAMAGQFDKAVAHAERGLTLEPNSAAVLFNSASALAFAGKPEDAIPLLHKAMRLNPFGPGQYYALLSTVYRMTGQYTESVEQAKKAVERDPKNQFGYTNLAAACVLAGREEEARVAAEELLKINPKFNLQQYSRALPYKDRSQIDRLIESLRKAGLPDKPPLPLPDKPSIAVLPFANMSDDPKQEFFADGLAEEIINGLGKLPQVFVIARNSSFTYKGKSVDVRQVGREMGVKYVLEGSVRTEGDRVRVTAQLIDAATGNHLFSERYDRELKDIFALQDDLTMKILTALQVTLTQGEQARSFARGTDNLDAYLRTIEGREFMARLNRDDNALARKKFQEAISLDPRFARAYAGLSFVYTLDFMFRVDPQESLKKAHEYAQQAISLDETQLFAYGALEFVHGWKREYAEAIASGEQAVRVAPGCADAYFYLGRALGYASRDQEAISHLEKAIRMNPLPPAYYFMHLGMSHFNLKQHGEAASALKKALALGPKNVPARACLIAAYVEMGRVEEAKAEAEELLKIDPKYTSKGIEKRTAFKDETVRQRWAEALRKAGLERDVGSQ